LSEKEILQIKLQERAETEGMTYEEREVDEE
jgi:hypothetical protein